MGDRLADQIQGTEDLRYSRSINFLPDLEKMIENYRKEWDFLKKEHITNGQSVDECEAKIMMILDDYEVKYGKHRKAGKLTTRVSEPVVPAEAFESDFQWPPESSLHFDNFVIGF